MHCDQHVRKMLIETAQMLSTAHRVLDGRPEEVEIKLPVSAHIPTRMIGGKIPLYRKTRKLKLLGQESATLTAKREALIDGKWYKVPEIGEPIPRRLLGFIDQDGQLKADKWNWLVDLNVKDKLCCIDTHANHGSAVWARTSKVNYDWLFQLYKSLNDEFNYRWGKDHACWLNWHNFLASPPKNISTIGDFTEPPQMMPDAYKNSSAIEAYREFYRRDKSTFATWSTRESPSWYLP
jgi:hypothetical protein